MNKQTKFTTRSGIKVHAVLASWMPAPSGELWVQSFCGASRKWSDCKETDRGVSCLVCLDRMRKE